MNRVGLLDVSFDSSNCGKLEGLFLGDSLGYTYGKVLGSHEVIKMVLSDGKVLGTILGNLYEITIGIDVETELVSLYVSFGVSSDGKLEGLFPGESLGYTDCKLLGSD